MIKALITGATGNIGSKLVKALAETDRVEVIPCYRKPEDGQAFEECGFKPRYLDMNDSPSITKAVQDIDTLFLLKPYSIQMLIQSKRILDAALQAGVSHVVNLGAHGADDTPWAIIGWHHMVERYTQALGFVYTHLRPNFFMDNLYRAVNSETQEIYHYLGDVPVSWISTTDIAACAATAICDREKHGGQTYSLACEALSLPQIAAMAEEISGRHYRYVRLPRDTGLETMLRLGREKAFIEPWLDYMDAISEGRVENIDATFSDSALMDRGHTQTVHQVLSHHLVS